MLSAENFSFSSFASVAVPIPYTSSSEFIYRIPEQLHGRITSGVCVIVPVNKRKTTGIVTLVHSSHELPPESNIKNILDIVEEGIVFSTDLIHLWKWAANYYLTSQGDMLKVMLPNGIRNESEEIVCLKIKNTNRNKTQEPYSSVQITTILVEQREQLSSNDIAVLSFISQKKRVTTKALRRQFSVLPIKKILHHLETLGVIEVKEYFPRRRVAFSRGAPEIPSEASQGVRDTVALSVSQEEAVRQIDAVLQSSNFCSFLLHGVTGSGKTAVYLQAAQRVIAMGKSVLVLVPEIALTSQLIEMVEQRFGARVAVLHSAMTPGERWAQWRRIASGEAKIVVGVRSAVFAPLRQLGLIVVDEEHDVAYKQQEGVRYNARDLAVMRGRLASCPVILGSATPSLESYMNGQTRRYAVLSLPERIESRPLPKVEIVDLRKEAKSEDPTGIFSRSLQQALIENYRAGKQSLLFINRRGYANYLQCHLCGEVVSCNRCSVTLTFHLRGRLLRCHYCGFNQAAFDQCPTCHETSLKGTGFGTEQVEEALHRFLPDARIARLDRDSTARRGVLNQVLKAWRTHEIDVLIGTQMVAKGHDVPGVTLVGVLRADSSLHFPDFRASERTFQVLTQVAGRAGRGRDSGRVIIQTYVPQHYTLRFTVQQNFVRFATYELRYRKQLGYPPFARMISIRCEGKNGEKVRACIEQVAANLLSHAEQIHGKAPVILGPAPAPLERLSERERWQILVKGEDRRVLHELVKKGVAALQPRTRASGIRLIVDVDPYDML